MEDRQQIIETAHLMADAARRAILPLFRTGILAENKRPAGFDPVTEADRAAETAMRRVLAERRPDDSVLGEEFGSRHGSSGLTWILDPIDGTRAFLRGEDTWCVSIAVIEQGRPVIGVIAAPALGEVFEVTAESITRLNGAVCRVSRPGADDRLRLAVPDGMRKRLDAAGSEPIIAEKAVPSLAYRLALVASGRLDGTLIRPRANDWDIAAADLLIERAGGLLCDRGGAPGLYRSEGKRHGLLMAASHDAMARVRQLARAIPD